MSKRIETPETEETVTIPKSSFDNIFKIMEQMRDEIAGLKELLSAKQETDQDRLLSITEAAEYCGVCRWTIGNYIKQKRLTKVVRGGRVGLLKSDLDKVKKV